MNKAIEVYFVVAVAALAIFTLSFCATMSLGDVIASGLYQAGL